MCWWCGLTVLFSCCTLPRLARRPLFPRVGTAALLLLEEGGGGGGGSASHHRDPPRSVSYGGLANGGAMGDQGGGDAVFQLWRR